MTHRLYLLPATKTKQNKNNKKKNKKKQQKTTNKQKNEQKSFALQIQSNIVIMVIHHE